jgi:hypothetical protein
MTIANPPVREFIPVQEDVLITGQCDCPVLLHIQGPEILMTFTDKAGDPVMLISVTPGNMLTLTNLETGKSITVMGTGVFLAKALPGGSIAIEVAGQGPAPPITEEPGLWYFTGRVKVTLDAEGNPTSISGKGRLVDLCARLEA